MKKVLLLHGWDYHFYKNTSCKSPWERRKKFIHSLEENVKISYLTFPGFCGKEEPNKEFYTLHDYVYELQKVIEKQENFDAIIGYAFGAAVALMWANIFNKFKETKLILVSPAITRKHKKHFLLPYLAFIKKFLPKKILSFLRDFYIRFFVKNPFYAKGTPFLRKSYLSIVREDISHLLTKNNEEIFLIYGAQDTATPPSLLLPKLDKKFVTNNVFVIPQGTHDIANTHTEELVEIIYSILKEV